MPDDAERREVRVAVSDSDGLNGNAELVGGHLRERRLVALAMGHLPGVDRDAAIGFEDRVDRLGAGERGEAGHDRVEVPGRPRSRFDVGRDPEAEAATLLPSRRLVLCPMFEVGDIESPLEGGLGRHAHIEGRTGEHRRREHVGTDDVAQPDLGAADPQLAGYDIE